MTDKARTAGTVKSADRLMAIFEHLAHAPEATLADIVRDLGIPTSSAYELLSNAVARRFVSLDTRTREYAIGPKIWEIARAAAHDLPLVDVAQPLMDRLRDQTEETVQLARLDGLENVYLALSESPHPMKLVSAVGKRLPAHATGLGKTLLASLPDDELHRRLQGATFEPMTASTITEVGRLLEEIETIRRQGYGEDREEYVIGCRCIAMPVRGPDGSTVAAMSVSAPTPRLTPAIEREIRDALTVAVAELEQLLRAT
jgi:DNA-binding IclR family transcriptional regulator